MPIVQFLPFSSIVQPAFWHAVTNLKIDVLKLSDDPLPITASYTVGRTVVDRESGKEIPLPCAISVGEDSLKSQAGDARATLPPGSVIAHGTFKNFNTVEEFTSADKKALFNQEAEKMWTEIISTRSTASLTRFFLITYADLKKYKYYYWFAFPAFIAKPAWEISDDGWLGAEGVFGSEGLTSIHALLKSHPDYPLPFFLIKPAAEGQFTLGKVEEYEEFFGGVGQDERTIALVDPSSATNNPGWPLRNLLAYLHALHPSSASIRVLCWRDAHTPGTVHAANGSGWKSLFGILSVKQGEGLGKNTPQAVGWEKNAQGKLGPRVADLGAMMDPKRLAEQAVDLNLKLMRWRILPSLDLEKVAGTKCLLLGAGTLGCYVARTLMGWGVRNITFVDSAKVSFSNPVRQPLFEFEDCLDGGKPKAQCAADRLKKIFPGINASGYALSIPMPGHPIPDTTASLMQAREDVKKLEQLFDNHDAVFLLMDSRESRWLPTVLGAAKGKESKFHYPKPHFIYSNVQIVLNAALGFDTFLVMRHGARAKDGKSEGRLGCYYCNDIVAPADSLTDRTLDQMCTVTRPGIAGIAASTAVELLASLLQHPEGIYAPAPLPNQDINNTQSYGEQGGSVLGLVPHQLRGFLAQFKNLSLVGSAYDKCTGCSETIIKAYEEHGFDMLIKAFNDQKYLEKLTGLDRLFHESEAAMESLNWDEEEDVDDDF